MSVKERPILFSGEMVRAILSGQKVQTRRPVKPQPAEVSPQHGKAPGLIRLKPRDPCLSCWEHACPFGQPGDRLWVQETWRPIGPWETRKETIQYRADGVCLRKTGWPESFRIKTNDAKDKWRSSRHMSRWASRITLLVTDVRVERVQEITEADAIAEGCEVGDMPGHRRWVPQRMFSRLWDSIYAERDYGWADNPRVWVVQFELAVGSEQGSEAGYEWR